VMRRAGLLEDGGAAECLVKQVGEQGIPDTDHQTPIRRPADATPERGTAR